MATISISGDFEKMRAWATKLGDVRRIKLIASKNLAEETLDLIREGFRKEADPYGRAWAPTQRGGKILQDNGHLKSGWKIRRASSRSFIVTPSVDYAGFHQHGTSRGLVPRPMVPSGHLPAEWLARYREIVSEVFKAYLT